MLTSAAVAAPCRTAASIVATTSVSIAAVAVSTAAVPTISAAAAAGSGLSTPDTFGTGIRYQRVAARAAPGSPIPVVTIYPVTCATPPSSAIAIAAAVAAGICARDKSASCEQPAGGCVRVLRAASRRVCDTGNFAMEAHRCVRALPPGVYSASCTWDKLL